MKYTFSTLLILIVFSANAQELKNIKKKSKTPIYTEKYTVLKSDENIKQGSYKKFGYKDILITEGHYVNNKKDSTWTEYFYGSTSLKYKGQYSQNEKTGIWTEYVIAGKQNSSHMKGEYLNDNRIKTWQFYENGILIQEYDYTNDTLIFINDSLEYDIKAEVKLDTEIKSVKIDKPPTYIGGSQLLIKNFLKSRLRYPSAAKAENISGKVIVSFFIDKEGKTIDYKVEQGIGGGCDEEALRVVKLIPNNWIAAVKDNQYVSSKYTFPVSFTMR